MSVGRGPINKGTIPSNTAGIGNMMCIFSCYRIYYSSRTNQFEFWMFLNAMFDYKFPSIILIKN